MSIKINHNSGFFSCCTVRLHKIISFLNLQGILPTKIDSLNQFLWYKKKEDETKDISYDFFEFPQKQFEREISLPIQFSYKHQFVKYKNVAIEQIFPVIKACFYPKKCILILKEKIKIKYNINVKETCVLFFRGNDKRKETRMCYYHEFLDQIKKIKSKNEDKEDLRILVQSDETEFLNYMKAELKNVLVLEDEIRHMSATKETSVDLLATSTTENNYKYAQLFLAIVLIMSECKYVVCTSGNISLWICLFRENAKNVFQYLSDQWYES